MNLIATDFPGSRMQSLVSYLEHDLRPTIVLDTDYNIIAANTAYQRQFGVEGTPHVGEKCYRVSHQFAVPCDQAGEHCPMRKAHETRLPERLLHIHHTPRGPEHVDVELRPILDDQGEVIAYVERLSSVAVASVQPQQHGLVGRSAAFKEVLSALQRAAPAQIPVLLQGESGTGKELFARALHASSARSAGPLVVVDCTGLTETLLESELFGYEKGAFTGALQRKTGLAEAAHGGTLFLDEIGEVPLAMQVKLLRAIQEKSIRSVGGQQEQIVDVRILCATHKNLNAEVAAGRFRQDLYYRLNVIEVRVPPLRERREDIDQLAASVLKRLAGNGAQPVARLNAQALETLKSYRFPGNVRELENMLERAYTLCENDEIHASDLRLTESASPQESDGPSLADIDNLEDYLESIERQLILQALEETRWNRTAAAERLSLSFRSLRYRLKKLGLD
ncbi:Fis family transcriptional regulator [Pseudomonas syringae pv. aceris]|uniref:sigma-54 interaction domain-containing protein n=2 Tax=Pseudomonas syringae TaxID=317 RepID=UPI000F3FBDFE|nr:sigma-54-dependent Fis family transcriptional regulator [Pseudomonas syringae]RMS62629.1 Fis family transcriptional regulator [Pseudomonas syringae pv. aceris]